MSWKVLNQCNNRDLKPENFLLLDERPETTLKVIDFGLSKVFSKLKEQKAQAKVSMTTRAGTVNIIFGRKLMKY